MEIEIFNPQQGHLEIMKLWMSLKPCLMVGKRFRVSVKEAKRSLPQNAMFHAIIGQIAKQAQHLGAKWDEESWKRFLVDQWANENKKESGKVVPSLDGQRIVQLGRQTKEFTKSEASEFTEWLIAWCAQNGIELNEHKETNYSNN